jgi:hypothetical protein
MKNAIVRSFALLLGVTMAAGHAMAADSMTHAVAGTVAKVDKESKTLVIKAADGTEHAFKYTDKTAVHAAKDAPKEAKKAMLDAYMDGKEGTNVIVHYTEKGTDKTAVAVEDLGKDGVKMSEGTITKVDQAAHTVTVKTKDGAEETYQLSKDAVIDTGKGVVKETKEGEKVTVHYTEESGKKIAHFLHSL